MSVTTLILVSKHSQSLGTTNQRKIKRRTRKKYSHCERWFLYFTLPLLCTNRGYKIMLCDIQRLYESTNCPQRHKSVRMCMHISVCNSCPVFVAVSGPWVFYPLISSTLQVAKCFSLLRTAFVYLTKSLHVDTNIYLSE